MLRYVRLADIEGVLEVAHAFDPVGELFKDLDADRVVSKTDEGTYRILTRIYPPKGTWSGSLPDTFLESIARGDSGGEPSRLNVKVTGVVIHANRLKRLCYRTLRGPACS